MAGWTDDDERQRERDYNTWSDSVAQNVRDMLEKATPEDRKSLISLVEALMPDNPAGVHQKTLKVCQQYKIG